MATDFDVAELRSTLADARAIYQRTPDPTVAEHGLEKVAAAQAKLDKTVAGGGHFATIAEKIAHGIGTARFLEIQTGVVVGWIALNVVPVKVHGKRIDFDKYPFILLNLAFSTQAAYAAPLILLAERSQVARDKAAEAVEMVHSYALMIKHGDAQALRDQRADVRLAEYAEEQRVTARAQDSKLDWLIQALTDGGLPVADHRPS